MAIAIQPSLHQQTRYRLLGRIIMRIDQTAPRDQNHVPTRRHEVALQPHGFPHQTAHPVPHHGVADTFASDKAKTTVRQLVGTGAQNNTPVRPRAALETNTIKICRTGQPQRFGQHKNETIGRSCSSFGRSASCDLWRAVLEALCGHCWSTYADENHAHAYDDAFSVARFSWWTCTLSFLQPRGAMNGV